jgi:hypothetical protein
MEYQRSNSTKEKQTACPTKYPQGRFKDKECRKCGTSFSPRAPSEFYCSEPCRHEASTDRYLERTYGIDYAEYTRMLEEQGGRCAICRGEGFTMKESHSLKLVVDHCHSSGAVRGLLCHNCNRSLGLFKDNPATIRKAIDYLSK